MAHAVPVIVLEDATIWQCWLVERWSFWRKLNVDRIVRRDAREPVGRLVRLVFEIEAIVALARATLEHGFVLREVIEDEPRFEAEGYSTRRCSAPLLCCIDPPKGPVAGTALKQVAEKNR